MCLLAICTHSFVNYLLKSFAHFILDHLSIDFQEIVYYKHFLLVCLPSSFFIVVTFNEQKF